MAETRGGDFGDGARSMAVLQILRESPDFYRDVVDYDLDASPGGKAVQKGPTTPPVVDANNVGTQGGDVKHPTFWAEGGPVSLVANQVPTINAVGGLHDVFQVELGTGLARDVFNAPGMPVAAVITWSGFVGRPLQGAPQDQLGQSMYREIETSVRKC